MNKKIKNTPILIYIFAIAPFLGGISQHYQVFLVAITSVALLIARRNKHKSGIIIDLHVFVPLIAIIIFAFFSIFYGVSLGDALYGFMHVLTAVLFFVLLETFSKDEREEAIGVIPYVASAMVVITGVAFFIPGLRDILYVNSRMGGPFEYPNTFGLFLLIGLYIYLTSLSSNKNKLRDYIIPFILIVGILFTGSRSIFVMTICLSIYILIFMKNARKLYALLIVVAAVIGGAYILFTSDISSIGRFLTTSIYSSTFLGRILYDIDAVNMIVDRPYGYGYLGYYFVEPFFQSGVYSVRFVHNDWLQIALDYGVLSLFATIYLYGLALYRADVKRRVILILIGFHMLFDFDLQFFSILMIVLICFTTNQLSDKRKGVIRIKRTAILAWTINILSIFIIAMCMWLGVADFMQSHNMKEESLHLYPWAADVKLHAIVDASVIDMKSEYASDLINEVPYIGLSYDVLAKKAIEDNDAYTAIDMKRNSVIYQKYNIDKYEEYAMLLCDIVDSYKNQDKEVLYKALSCLYEIPEMINKTKNETSSIAYKINDVPTFVMDKEVTQRIDNILYEYKEHF